MNVFKSYRLLFIHFLITYLTLVTAGLQAQNHKKIPPDKPKLIVGIVLGQMRYDYLFRYWDKLGQGGFKRLVNEGTFCKDANYNYLYTQNSPGYATISTGAMPSVHGIVADQWYDRLKNKTIICTEDDAYSTTGGSYDVGRRSPLQLLSSTIGDELRISNNFKSKVISISLDAEASILSAGHTATGAYWYDKENGNWVTSSYYADSIPAWVTKFNQKKFPDIYLDHQWETLMPISSYTESLADNSEYEVGINKQRTFPYNLSTISRKSNGKRNYDLLKYTPFGNNYTKDFAISAIVEENLGKHDYPDVILIGFSASEYIGRLYGANSVEMEDIFLRLDKDLEHFLSFIDENIGFENTLLYLTADHGIAIIPKYLEANGVPSGIFNQNQAMSLLGSYLNVLYGKGEWIKLYSNQQIYLNQNLIEDSKLSLEAFQTTVAQFMVQFTGVANTMTTSTLQKSNFTSGIFYKMQNSYNQKRTGDVILNLEPGWIDMSENATLPNSSYSYDAHVPLIWYGWKIPRKTIYQAVDITSIAPTISGFLDILSPNGSNATPMMEMIQ
jgi:predicted AlkP superfamily pyrophosphatase or phosphodiesterase